MSTDTLAWSDHGRRSETLRATPGCWLLTYDHDERVRNDLHPGLRCIGFSIAHTAARQTVGREYAVFSEEVLLTTFDGLRVDGPHVARLLRSE